MFLYMKWFNCIKHTHSLHSQPTEAASEEFFIQYVTKNPSLERKYKLLHPPLRGEQKQHTFWTVDKIQSGYLNSGYHLELVRGNMARDYLSNTVYMEDSLWKSETDCTREQATLNIVELLIKYVRDFSACCQKGDCCCN